jgi:hypothetical protein
MKPEATTCRNDAARWRGRRRRRAGPPPLAPRSRLAGSARTGTQKIQYLIHATHEIFGALHLQLLIRQKLPALLATTYYLIWQLPHMLGICHTAAMPNLTTLTVGRFIRELITGISPVSILLEEWGLDHDTYMELRKTKVFQQELAAAVADVQRQGPDASYVMRMKLLSEEFFGDIEKIVRDDMAPHSVKMDAIKFVAEMARLRPEKKQDAVTGTSVNFNFGGNVGKLLGIDNVLEVKPELTHTPEAPS